jgi:hypothetical protein
MRELLIALCPAASLYEEPSWFQWVFRAAIIVVGLPAGIPVAELHSS